MANDHNIKNFTAYDIEKYHKGLLSSKERHELEKAALDDPFLADALEGYAMQQINLEADFAGLKRRLEAKTEGAKVIPLAASKKRLPWLRIAAMLILIAGAGLLSYQLLNNKSQNKVAVNKQPATEKAKVTDSALKDQSSQISTTFSDTTSDKSNANLFTNSGTKTAEENNKVIPQIADKDNKTKFDSIKSDIALQTNPVAKTIEKTEEFKTNNELPLPKNEITSSKLGALSNDDKSSKEVTAKNLLNKDGDGVSDKPEDYAKQKKAAIAPEANRRAEGEGFIQEKALYKSPNIFRGKVTDANGNAMPFANVTNTSDNVGTYSDAKGNFTLISGDSVMNVQVKSLGFENNTVFLMHNIAENRIVMQEDRSITANVLDSSKRSYSWRSRNTAMTFEEPEPADGWPAYNSYLANNVNIPDNLEKQKKISGDAVEVSFEVNKLGEPVNIKIEKSLCEKCDKEAIRLIREGPKWKRKAKKGRKTVIIPFSQ
jgi:hypothetical protein